eukprot:gene7523-12779_t
MCSSAGMGTGTGGRHAPNYQRGRLRRQRGWPRKLIFISH